MIKTTVLLLIIGMFLALTAFSVKKMNPESDDTIQKVKIGEQVWMSINLNVDRFQNGDSIPEAKTNEEWDKAATLKQPAWCYYENDKTNGEKFGKLYNWYALSDSRGIAPKGWRVPTEEDWKKLITYLGGKKIAGSKMKSKIGWKKTRFNKDEIDPNGTNESSFSALPAGSRGDFQLGSVFLNINFGAYFWSATDMDGGFAYSCSLGSSSNEATLISDSKDFAMSVRCIK